MRSGKHHNQTFIGRGPTVNRVIMMVIPIFTGIIQMDTLAILPFGTPKRRKKINAPKTRKCCKCVQLIIRNISQLKYHFV